MTKLESELTRLTALIVDGREVDVTLLPADESTLTPERLQLHLKGTQQYKVIPLPTILGAVGWKVQMKKGQAKESPYTSQEDFEALMVALAPWKR